MSFFISTDAARQSKMWQMFVEEASKTKNVTIDFKLAGAGPCIHMMHSITDFDEQMTDQTRMLKHAAELQSSIMCKFYCAQDLNQGHLLSKICARFLPKADGAGEQQGG